MTNVLDLPSTTLLPTDQPARRPPRPLPLVCKLCRTLHAALPSATCEECLGPLEPWYEADRRLPDAATIARRPPSIWR